MDVVVVVDQSSILTSIKDLRVLTNIYRYWVSIDVCQNLPVGVIRLTSSHIIHTLKVITIVRILCHSESVDKDIEANIGFNQRCDSTGLKITAWPFSQKKKISVSVDGFVIIIISCSNSAIWW